MSTTHEIFIEPCAIVVGLPDEHVVLCHEVIGQAGLRVHKSKSLEAACEKILRALPHIVVASAALPTEQLVMIEDRTIAVGAVFVLLSDERDYEQVVSELS